MKEVSELQEELDVLTDQMQRLADSNLDDAGRRQFDQLEAKARKLNADIRRLTSLDSIQRESRAPVHKAPMAQLVRGDGDWSETRTSDPAAKNGSYRSLYGGNLDTGGYRSFAEFVGGLVTGEKRNLSTGSDGHVVPTAFAQSIFDLALEDAIIRPRATVYPVQRAGSIRIPAWDGEDHSSTLYGGLSASWVAEGGTVTNTDPKTRQIQLDPKKLISMVYVSRELTQDSIVGFAESLQAAMARTVNFELEDSFWNGNGAGRPLGIANADCVIEVAKETDQEAATIYAENVAKMYSRMLPSAVREAIWVCHPSCIPALATMSVVIGAGGAYWPLMNETNGQFAIFGRPVFLSEVLQELGTAGDIWFVSPRHYAIGLAQEVAIDFSQSVRWTTDEVSWRCCVRADGAPLLDAAVTPRRGTSTMSPFIKLATRA